MLEVGWQGQLLLLPAPWLQPSLLVLIQLAAGDGETATVGGFTFPALVPSPQSLVV